MTARRLFNQREVNRIFSHVPIKTLRWWGLQGLYTWISQSYDKRGISREYEIANLYQIGILENLSSLDVSITTIRIIMNSIANNPSMDKILFISKHPVKSKEITKRIKKPFYMWHHLIIKSENINHLIAHYRTKYRIATIIIIDLAIIKEFVDSLIKEI